MTMCHGDGLAQSIKITDSVPFNDIQGKHASVVYRKFAVTFIISKLSFMENTTDKERIRKCIGLLDLSCRREIDLIVLHCSATPEGRDVCVSNIRRWHVDERGFTDIGYHFVVRLDGTVEPGRPPGMAGAHCRGHNTRSIGVCYVGGADTHLKSKDTRTPQQRVALDLLVDRLLTIYPHAVVKRHSELAATACPGF